MDEGQEGLLVVRDLFQGRRWPPSHLRIFSLLEGLRVCAHGVRGKGERPWSL